MVREEESTSAGGLAEITRSPDHFAKRQGEHLQMLSTLTSCPVEEVLAARGGSGLKDIDISTVRSLIPNFITWDYVKRVREVFPGKLLLKGIVTREDGELAVRHGLDGIVVSNHGGRAEESYIGTIESLREVIEGTRRRIPVLVDSGFRRGTDIFKALALGATAVGVGRPYVWGLAAYGQAGAEAVLRILRDELRMSMQQAGTRSIAEITPASIVRR
jgi:isopentenyl diphosphate isomerase/L-lactate dehydrogenase-like FMN-dependent dehydrogenase